ncbi:hypothetical protein [Micromonospora sp. NPDC002575]|uniref:hypothetical protein n=1 Tax=Micromonospora sp. NPDC002575 TaxID=3364222 RepID=UPI0036C31C03
MRTLLLFDGIGSTNENLLPALRELYSAPENAAFFQAAFDAFDEVAAYLDPPARARLCPDGSALRQWLGAVGGAPQGSVAAGICVHLYQACHLQPARGHPDGVVGSLGHSIGLLAAILAGLRLRRMDEFLGVATALLRLVAVSLVRAHQLDDGPTPDADAVARYLTRGHRGVGPGPMAALSGVPRAELRGMVAAFNDTGGSLTVGLANSPGSHVLSGLPAELLAFYFAHEPRLGRAGVSWAFLPTTIPFHSPRLTPAARRIDDDRRFIGPLPAGDRLRLPVYAIDGPRNLQGSPDLVAEFLAQVLLRPIEWEVAARHAVSDAAVDRVVDFGPGPAARRFTRECLDDVGRRLRFEPVRQFPRPGR